MKRLHIFEFEDLGWFPDWIRVLMVRYLNSFHRLIGSAPTIANLVARAMKQSSKTSVVDLCSGGGGVTLDFMELVRTQHGIGNAKVTLTDLYPNQSAAAAINQQNNPLARYVTSSINAAEVDESITGTGVRTMVCCMHHMRPAVARSILKNAKDAREPIVVFEISDNSPPAFLWWLAIPFGIIMTLILTPMIRPMTWQQIVFTYLVPILPIFIGWDGAVSNVRTYTESDLKELLQGLESDDYTWEIGKVKSKAGRQIYLIGMPR